MCSMGRTGTLFYALFIRAAPSLYALVSLYLVGLPNAFLMRGGVGGVGMCGVSGCNRSYLFLII